ncbi:VanZ family protein [Oxalobacteraceae bacterium OM1]|nr:VanZ family protein [Oxalobacteraceae bacterium OM1]
MELALLLCLTAAVSAGCLVPARWLPPLPNDKLMHFVAFGLLALLAVRIAQGSGQRAAALVIVFVIGLVIELLQNTVPGRKFCWRDLIANTAGIALAALIA